MYRSYFLSSFGVDIEKLVFDVDDWSARCLFLPSAAEQRSLCALFQRLDSLITLHQREGRACSVCWLRLALGASCRFVSVSALG
ncbi:hypothetical protein D1643_04095 [Enterorhabdus sp. P55]|nr:hypothetical protein [Enterorhabdus sp. P55]